MSTANPIAVVEGNDESVLVPEGTYDFFISHWTTTLYLGRTPKVYLFFFIGSGEYQGLILRRCYNVRRLTSPPGPSGSFTVSRHMDYYREFVDCLGLPDESGSVLPERYDRMVLGDVVTVRKDSKGRTKPEALWYSKIECLKPVDKQTT